MKNLTTILALILMTIGANAQTNLIANGGFEATNAYTNWSHVSNWTNIWAGAGACSSHGGSNYLWLGDQPEQTGVNNATEDIYQTVTIPSTTLTCVLDFWASVNTKETSLTTVSDYVNVNIKNTSGTLLYSLKQLSNLDGTYGIPGCQVWKHYTVNVPSAYFGSTVRVSFEFSTDFLSNPTIFRLDDISLNATLPCSYSLSQSTYTCADALLGIFINAANVITQTGCSWTASVTSGSSWLSTSSSGTGNGIVVISVQPNNSLSPRTGTINVNGQTLTVTQPALTCVYSLSQPSYICANAAANTYSNIVSVTTQSVCNWSASVTTGSSWLSTSSSGTGNGNISITVTQNTTSSIRTGNINLNGQTLTIVQPASNTGINEIKNLPFSIFPNPSQNQITIEAKQEIIGEDFEITDNLGRNLIHGKINDLTTTVALDNLKAGIYLFRINSKGLVYKLVKQ